MRPADAPTYTVAPPSRDIIQVDYTAELVFSPFKSKVKVDTLTIEYVTVADDTKDAAAIFVPGKPAAEITGASVIKLLTAE